MTNQSHPPSDAAQLAQARTAVEVAERKARDWEDVVKRQRGEITRLLSLIGAETPIAAFSLAETWQAEKAGYMERVEALTLELDGARKQLDPFIRVAILAHGLALHLRNSNKITDARFYDALWDALEGLNGAFAPRVASNGVEPARAQSEETRAGYAPTDAT